jgi:hypothetical protein
LPAYRLTAADLGKRVKVEVSFIDDDGYPETVPSQSFLCAR